MVLGSGVKPQVDKQVLPELKSVADYFQRGKRNEHSTAISGAVLRGSGIGSHLSQYCTYSRTAPGQSPGTNSPSSSGQQSRQWQNPSFPDASDRRWRGWMASVEVGLEESKPKVMQASAPETKVTRHPSPVGRDMGRVCSPCTAPPGRVPAHPFHSLYQGALPPRIWESLFFFFRTSFNHHTVKEPHSEDSFSGHRVPFLPPLSIVCVSYFSESLQEFEISRYSSPFPCTSSPSPLCPRWSIWAAKKKKSLPGGLVTLGSPIVPWTHRPICDHKKTHHTLSTPHHRVFASPRRPQSGFPTTNV